MKNEKLNASVIRMILFHSLLLILVLSIVVPSFAWFYKKSILAYAPVSSNESLYIGAGHIEITEGVIDPDVTLEDVRYLYLNGIDATDTENEYQDFVFCVYGQSISHFRLQLSYTTNNQFTYEIYNATQAEVNSEGAVRYDTHDETNPRTYYYSATGVAVAGTYLNKTVSDGKTIADSTKHTATYGSYSSAKVNTYGEPIYWQSSEASPFSGASMTAFVRYFILRVHKGDKEVNDRETDVICIAAKSSSAS